MNILEKIVTRKKEEVAEAKLKNPVEKLEKTDFFQRDPISLVAHLTKKNSSGIIAEFKRKSPSKGIINAVADVAETTTGYARAGAAALSILTDEDFFGGANQNLIIGRQHNVCPILRKDFTIDEYQVIEAKSIGADAILLIAAILTPQQILQLGSLAKSLGLEVLLEVHNQQEIEETIAHNYVAESIDLVGVNNRNLKTFEVSIETSMRLSELIPDNFVKISESGISNPVSINQLKQYGYQGFLIGENFMKTDHPAKACQEFIQSL